jgi:hypothetical protein
MTSTGGNGAAGYQLVQSSAINQELRRIFAGLSDAAAQRRFTAALRGIRRRLRTDPKTFGERLYPLYAIRQEVRLGAIAPLSVRFGVHWDLPLVFIVTYDLLS